MSGRSSTQQPASRVVPHVFVLSGVPLNTSIRFALASRLRTLASDIRAAGFEVCLVAPDAAWGPHEHAAPTSGHVRPRARGEGIWADTSLGVIDAGRTLWRALKVLKESGDNELPILLSTGTWMPLAASFAGKLRGGAIQHLDVPGIPSLEVRLSKTRLWRAKAQLYEALFRRATAHSQIVSTINQRHATILCSDYQTESLIVPDLLSPEWLSQLLRLRSLTETGDVSVLYAGSLMGGRIDLFLKVASRLRQEKRFRVVVVGDGPDRARYRARYEPDGIEFPGYVSAENLLQLYEGSDICYSDVWHDIGMPYKILEYMAAGRAVVSHDTASLRETITSGREGLLCDKTEASLRDTLLLLLNDPGLRIQLADAGRTRIRALHEGDRLRGLPESYHRMASVYPNDIRRSKGVERANHG